VQDSRVLFLNKVYLLSSLSTAVDRLTVVLSHDVDSVKRPLSHILARRKRFAAKDLLKHFLKITNLYNNFSIMADAEEKLGYRSTIFVPVGLFSLDEVLDTLKSLEKEGWEIGYHPVVSGNQTYGLLKLGLDYLKYLGFNVKGVRAHYLIYTPSLLDCYRRLGILYDSSLRAEEAGKYSPFVEKGLVELPIGLMDADVFGRLMVSDESKAWKYIMWKLSLVEKSGERVFVVLFHQEALRMRGGRLYFRLLEYLHEKEYTVCKCIEVVEKALREVKNEAPSFRNRCRRGRRSKLH